MLPNSIDGSGLPGFDLMPFSYLNLRRLGLGAHLAAIVLLAAIPTSLLVVKFIDNERREAIEDARNWAQSAALHAAEHHREKIRGVQMVLEATAARLENVATPAPCQLPANLQEVVWLIQPGGYSACSTDADFPMPQPVINAVFDDADAADFEVVGPYHAGRDNAWVIGELTKVTSGGVTWHVAYRLDLAWRPALHPGLADSDDVVFMAVDDTGAIVDRTASGAELSLGGDAEIGAALPAHSSIEGGEPMTFVDIDGVRRIFGTADLPESGVTVMVGLSEDGVLARAQRELINSLALFAGVLTVSGLLAWLVIERMILRSVRKLRDAAVATARGEQNRRVVVKDGPVELRQLADAFNEMTTKLEFQAFHDQLTGLANRRFIQLRLDEMVAGGQTFAVLAIDLDGFKPINDTHGHAIGDFVLAQTAQRLSAGLGEGAFIGRTGGDEFLAAVVTDGTREADMAAAADAARSILDVLSKPILLENGAEVSIGGSVGVAFWPSSGMNADGVIREADSALYRAKKSGRNCFVMMGEIGHSKSTEAA